MLFIYVTRNGVNRLANKTADSKEARSYAIWLSEWLSENDESATSVFVTFKSKVVWQFDVCRD